jgi:single-stranded DNA-binding protein
MGTKQSEPGAHGQVVASETETETGLNQAIIMGQFVAEPEFRTLPSGSVAASFALRVRSSTAKTTSVPVVWYDPPKRLGTWTVGEMVIVRGSVVRRFFQAARGLGSSTEVVVRDGERARHHVKSQTIRDRGASELRTVADE